MPGLDLRQVEDVVDDRQQVRGGRLDLVQALGLLRRRAGALQQVREAEDGVQRRADLVAHVGQEGALGLVGGLGPLPCLVEFRGALGDQFLQVVAVAIEFGAEALLFGDVLLDRDIVGDASVGLADRRDDGELDVLAAVLAPVVEFALPRLPRGQCLPHGGIGLRRRACPTAGGADCGRSLRRRCSRCCAAKASLTYSILPSRSVMTMLSGLCSTASESLRSDASARLRSVMSMMRDDRAARGAGRAA